MVGPLNSEKKFENMFTRFNTHLSNIEPPALRKKAATDKLVEKIVKMTVGQSSLISLAHHCYD